MKYWRYDMGMPDMEGCSGGWDWEVYGVSPVGLNPPMEMGQWRRNKGPGTK